MTETKATTTEPSPDSAAALVKFVTRAKVSPDVPASDPGQAGPLALDLWSSRISAPNPTDDAEASLSLKRLIRQVHSMTFSNQNEARPSTPPAEAVPTVALPAPTVVSTGQAEPAPPEAVAAPETVPALSPRAQKTFDNLRQNPSRVRDPMEAADLLFLSGRPTDAIPFYEELLRRTGVDAVSGDDRAWALFQLGNCLRETNATKAQEAYAKLIVEYPGSPWTEMAKAGSRLLTWYQSARPDQMATARQP